MQSFIKLSWIQFGDYFKVIDEKYVHHFDKVGKVDGIIFDNALRLTFPNGDNFKFNFDEIIWTNEKGIPYEYLNEVDHKKLYDFTRSDEFWQGMKKAIRESKE